ncbi:HAD-IIIA family hydrolase [Actinoalloteichus hymeniacidonis]|uniref:D,D-heptose 1,7-bisphosphate phosphatase n=1 Tax=Actinoalloteichus hymeniacidonis TaxID=340345 RepID=A0AAC9HSS8_9PSEU|nr:HAD-IIIA family hydrolase [Actinoalloteichus hymeniacidonis]AOS64705.1 HAD family hydrolase [Actinoalloteichus hymeniacidonis]MBB5907219.1 histidinol-phosphate phosphatase family protein [Actinoalloteichus hymeniacidonis]
MIDYSIVIPTTGRDNLWRLLTALRKADGPPPREIIVVDDRAEAFEDLALPASAAQITLLRSGGRGPAAARNVGWRQATAEWIAFLDDDVITDARWPARLAADLTGLDATVGASQARIEVPLPDDRRPTDDERGTAGLAGARWITADMAYRRTALAVVGGFDERFTRAYREDADLALRVIEDGYAIVSGHRVTTHPARRSGVLASVRAQRGNADDVLMRRKHGVRWRSRIGEGHGRLGWHAVTTAAGAAAGILFALGHRRAAAACGAGWAALTGRFAASRIAPGPRTADEIGRMLLTSVLIPPVACWQRLRGELRYRTRRHRGDPPPLALLFDRDDTLIVNVPYLADPEAVRPMPGARDALHWLRREGIRIGVVSNQSGVARGLISQTQLAAVNARVEELLGPIETWQICVHDTAEHCVCRKPAPGMVEQAARALGVDVARCVVIGDTGADVAAARAAGARAILVPTAATRQNEIDDAHRHARVARDLAEAVALALAGVR